MTLCEKIIAAHAVVDAKADRVGVPAVQPGDALFVRTDVRFSHEYVTPMAESFFRAGLGPDATVTEPESVYAFRDHLTFLDRVMSPEAHIKLGLREQAASLATVQEAFTTRQGIKLYGEVVRDGRDGRLGGHLPQQGHRGDRPPRPGGGRHRLAHVHGGRARLLRLRGGLDRHGQRVAHPRRPRRRPAVARASTCTARCARA